MRERHDVAVVGRFILQKGEVDWGRINLADQFSATFLQSDITQVIRLGLIGGSGGTVDGRAVDVSPVQAQHLVDTYVIGQPLAGRVDAGIRYRRRQDVRRAGRHGMTKFGDRLRRMRAAAEDAAAPVMMAAADVVAKHAQISITEGSVSGKNHAASQPGRPPNNDTGVLANNIETERLAKLHVRVTSNAPYAAALEFGTSRMGERPYMRPAAHDTREEVFRLINEAAKRGVRAALKA